MTDYRGIDARVDRLAADVAELSGDEMPVMVMAGEDLDHDDPRLDAIVAQAQRERRGVVTPWEETEVGELVDTSSAAYAATQTPSIIEPPRP